MQPTSTLCRAQEVHHDALAHAATLDNVRHVARTAARAWAKEGLAAELREQRKLRTRAFADAQVESSESVSAILGDLSENPDRGHASHN